MSWPPPNTGPMNAPASPPIDPLAHLTAQGRPHFLLDLLTAAGEGAACLTGAFAPAVLRSTG